MSNKIPDFEGWAAKYGVRCSDGTVMAHGAFAGQNGTKVPLVYQHEHSDVRQIIGHSYLYNKPEGLWASSYLNETDTAAAAAECVRHGDLDSYSIFANNLTRNGNTIQHGLVREVSLVIAGADPTARIVNTSFGHSDGTDDSLIDEATIYSGEILIAHDDVNGDDADDSLSHEDKTEDKTENKSVQDIIDTMNDEQKAAHEFMVEQGIAYAYKMGLKEAEDDNDDDDSSDNTGDENIKHSEGGNDMPNVFERYANGGSPDNTDFIKHCAEFEKKAIKVLHDGKFGSSFFKEILELANKDDEHKHSALTEAAGFENIDWLFPDAKNTTNEPKIIRDNEDWVTSFMGRSTHLPYSRVRTLFADYTPEELRAKGYMKGHYKEEAIIKLARRVTEPTTVYVKRSIHEDDLNDIVDFDALAMIKNEMKPRLNSSIAEAALIGDGRSEIDEDKINEERIRPIWTEDDFFVIHVRVPVAGNATIEEKNAAIEEAVLRARKKYKGSGNMTLFTTEDALTDWRLMKDGIGHKLYKSDNEVAQALRCNDVQTVNRFDNKTRTVTYNGSTETRTLYGIMVNPKDYGFGTNQGGAIRGFEGFDIDYNKHKMLQETRTSGALIEAYSAIVIETVPAT